MSVQPAPYFHYQPNFGDRNATYTAVNFREHPGHRPEIAARFIATVEGDAIMSTIRGGKSVAWRAEPGTPCLILGWWSDGTVHVKWRGIAGSYTVDGRFPAWVVAEDPAAAMAGGDRILSANNPPAKPAAFLRRLLGFLNLR